MTAPSPSRLALDRLYANAPRRARVRYGGDQSADDVAYIPLHQQALAWGVRNNVELKQRPDNQFDWRHVRIK